MKLCWDNLEGFTLTSAGNLRKHGAIYIEKESCIICGSPYLMHSLRPTEFCSVSCNKKGIPRPKHVKIKISNTRKELSIAKGTNNPNFGKKTSKETKDKISKSLISRKMSKEFSRKQTLRLLGSNNPNWKGGLSKLPYCPNWTKSYKKEIKERDNHVCQNPYCYSKDSLLHVHHVDYTKTICGPDNLITVCRSCNSRANKDREWHTDWYRAILNKKYGYTYEGVI